MPRRKKVECGEPAWFEGDGIPVYLVQSVPYSPRDIEWQKRTLERHGVQGGQVVPYATTFIFPCACGKKHSHGYAELMTPSHRVAHCAERSVHPRGYYIYVVT